MRNDHMEEDLERPFIEKFSDSLGAMIILATAFHTYTAWSDLPDRIATHFDWTGTPNSYGGRWTLLMTLGLMVLIYITFMVITRFPNAFNYIVKITEENRKRQQALAIGFLHLMGLEVTVILAYIQWSIIHGALRDSYKFNSPVMTGLIAILFITIGIYCIRSIRSR